METWGFSISLPHLSSQRQLCHLQRMLPGTMASMPCSLTTCTVVGRDALLLCMRLVPCLNRSVCAAAFIEVCRIMQAGDHANHDYSMYFSFAGGCCDCGDATSWKPSGFCPKHTGQSSRQQHTSKLDVIEEVTARAVLSWAVQELCWAVCNSVRPASKPFSSPATAWYMLAGIAQVQ